MDLIYGGDCEIRLRKKIDENHGERVYSHVCRESTKNKDFAIYYDLEEKIKNNSLDDSYIEKLNKAA
jgi:hypothetical protein